MAVSPAVAAYLKPPDERESAIGRGRVPAKQASQHEKERSRPVEPGRSDPPTHGAERSGREYSSSGGGRLMPHRKDEYKNAGWLRDRYHGDRMTMQGIADLTGKALGTIQYWMDEHEIDRRTPAESLRSGYCTVRVDRNGHAYWRSKVGGVEYKVFVHRLAAVAWFGFESVVDKVVHHEVPAWPGGPDAVAFAITTEDNVRPMEKSEHRAMHNRRRAHASS